MFITITFFCSIGERMQKHVWVACFKLKVRKSVFYTFTLLIFVKTRACSICNAAVLSPATFLYFNYTCWESIISFLFFKCLLLPLWI